MFKSIFEKHNQAVREAHIKKHGVDIYALTNEQKAEYMRLHTALPESNT